MKEECEEESLGMGEREGRKGSSDSLSHLHWHAQINEVTLLALLYRYPLTSHKHNNVNYQ